MGIKDSRGIQGTDQLGFKTQYSH